MSSPPPVVCLLTDFGLKDHYVGAMKGVILSLAPHTQIVDLSHEVSPQDIRSGAFQLLAAYSFFPANTFFICVVDPGVGSERKIIYAEAGKWRFIAPDNGLLSWVFATDKPRVVLELNRVAPEGAEVSKTFHGRDILAPVVGHILKGEPATTFGKPAKSWVSIPFPEVAKVGSQWTGEVVSIDGFGNLITNFRTAELLPLSDRSKMWIELGTGPFTVRGLAETYVSVEKGKLLAIGGSAGYLEISVRDGSAARETKLKAGDEVRLHFKI